MIFSIVLGSGQTGLTLQAQLVNPDGSYNGSPITSGFVEIGAGNYLWNYNPGTFVGMVVFEQTNNTVMAVADVNPTLPSSALDGVTVEPGMNARQALSVICAALAGVLELTATNTVAINGANSDTNRITATVNSNGERLAVTLNLPS